MNKPKLGKDTGMTIVYLTISIIVFAFLLFGPKFQTVKENQEALRTREMVKVKLADVPAPVELDLEAIQVEQTAPVEEAEPIVEETYYEEPIAYDSQPQYTEYYEGYDNDFQSQGVVYDQGTRYTWYSSNVLYHWQTPEWSVNGDGFYQTADGYLVVASSDYAQGTVVDTPWGQGMVLDSGCASGTVDMYTAF